MVATYQKIEAFARTASVRAFAITDAVGEPVPITGMALGFTAKYGDVTLFTKSTDDGDMTITDGPGGLGTITFTADDLDLDGARYDFFIDRLDVGLEDVLSYGDLCVIGR